MNLTAADLWTLAMATAIIAGALLLEHVAFGKTLSKENRYAMGFLTDAGILLAWGAIRDIHLDPVAALLILATGCVAGVPVYVVLHREQARELAQWNYLVETNRALASELALLQVAGNGHRYSRAHDLIESICFIHGGVAKDLTDMQLLVSQLQPLLDGLLASRVQNPEWRYPDET